MRSSLFFTPTWQVEFKPKGLVLVLVLLSERSRHFVKKDHACFVFPPHSVPNRVVFILLCPCFYLSLLLCVNHSTVGVRCGGGGCALHTLRSGSGAWTSHQTWKRGLNLTHIYLGVRIQLWPDQTWGRSFNFTHIRGLIYKAHVRTPTFFVQTFLPERWYL